MPSGDSTPAKQPTEVLVRWAQAADRDALGVLVERHLPEIRAYVRLNAGRIVRIRESCSDLVQTVCKDVLANLGQFEWRGEQSFKSWLFVAVLNKIRMHERHWQAERRDPAREVRADATNTPPLEAYRTVFTPSQQASAREELERVEAAFDEMPPDYREVITLSRICGLSHEEIAERLGRTPGATKTLLSRAVARLTTILDSAAG